jgi:hypothetical protein
VNPALALYLWLGTWHLEASRFYTDWAEKLIELE